MSLTALPTELLDAICEPLASNASTLASLARACAATHGSAMRMLYRSVSVSTYAGNLPIVHTLAIRPELARHVRSFAITLDDSDAVLRPYYALLQAALQQMSQLESLELHVDSTASWVLLDLNDPSRLEHFACAFPLDPNVTAFLSRTPALRSLQIADPAPSTVPALHSMHFPLLESYTGPASLLPLLASRPLTTIHLSGDLKIEDIPHSGSAPGYREANSREDAYLRTVPKNSDLCEEAKTGDVQIMSAITSAPPVLLLETLARAYPGLVCLRLMTTFAFWQAPDMVSLLLLCRNKTSLTLTPCRLCIPVSRTHLRPCLPSPSSNSLVCTGSLVQNLPGACRPWVENAKNGSRHLLHPAQRRTRGRLRHSWKTRTKTSDSGKLFLIGRIRPAERPL